MSSSSQSDDIDLVRLIGRIIFGVSLFLAIIIFLLVGVQGGLEAIPWNPGGVTTALAFLLSGGFAWALLRGVAQIRDRIEVVESDLTSSERDH